METKDLIVKKLGITMTSGMSELIDQYIEYVGDIEVIKAMSKSELEADIAEFISK